MSGRNSNKQVTRDAPVQGGLLGTALHCPVVEQLPLVTDDRGELEVLAPGHLYQPLLLKPGSGDIEIHPGALEKNERKFVVDLVKRLYPDGSPPQALGAPLKWGKREIHLRRNLDKDAGSFRLRVDDSDWYYPDFIIWIIDREQRIQTFGFVDPKGLYSAASGGWGDYKVVSTTYMPHVIEQQIQVAGNTIDIDGDKWAFRIRGVLVSVSSLAQLQQEAKFKVGAADGTDAVPNKEAFRRGRIVFNEDRNYIDEVLDLLVQDNDVDALLARAAAIFHSGQSPEPRDHKDAYLHIERNRQQDSDGGFAERLLKDLLLCDDFTTLNGAATHRAKAEFAEMVAKDPALSKHIGDPVTTFTKLLERLNKTG
ncbi:MAG: hypothetical protein JSR50_06540 [Proteobacteria bacterium]|nr:hypothetical protein [Pseudomonadota bacterium]